MTLSKAVELAGIDLYDFMSACKQEEILVIDINEEELREKLSGLDMVGASLMFEKEITAIPEDRCFIFK